MDKNFHVKIKVLEVACKVESDLSEPISLCFKLEGKPLF